MLTESELCAICASPQRNVAQLCVVESPADVVAIEQSGGFAAAISCSWDTCRRSTGSDPAELGLDEFELLLAGGRGREVILATNPTVEGEATAHYLGELALRRGIKASRIAHGVPVGGELEYVDGGTLAHALAGDGGFLARQVLVEPREAAVALVAARRDALARTAAAHGASRLLEVAAIVEAAMHARRVNLDEAALGGAHDVRRRREIAHARRIDDRGVGGAQRVPARRGRRVPSFRIAGQRRGLRRRLRRERVDERGLADARLAHQQRDAPCEGAAQRLDGRLIATAADLDAAGRCSAR
jgi:hypothetical protein